MSRARLGVDSFSYHRWFGETNQWEQPLGVRWSTGQLLEHVASIGVEVLSLQTIHLDDRNPANLSRFGTELAAAGVECILAWGHRSGLEDGQSEEKLNDALHAMDAALALGCRMMRVVCGDQYSWSSDPTARTERRAQLRGPLTSIARQAELVGLVVAVENHADATAAEIAQLVASIDPVHLGTCFDVGNRPRWRGSSTGHDRHAPLLPDDPPSRPLRCRVRLVGSCGLVAMCRAGRRRPAHPCRPRVACRGAAL